jgi:hypothetical protein
MSNQHSGTASAEHSIWIWIIFAALLVVGALIAVGALAIVNANQMTQLPTGSQSVPTTR